MKVRLLKAARINHNAGEIVEVSSAQAGFLLSVGAAEIVTDVKPREIPEQQKKTTSKKRKG